MKKIILISAAALCLLAFSTGCASVESKAKSYTERIIEASKAGDDEKVDDLASEFEAWYFTLSEEDKSIAEDAASSVALNALGDALKDLN